jgi:prophage DNA circulation protein
MPDGFLYEAEFAGFKLDVISSRIEHGRAVVEHLYPKRDGADLEDMGREPFRCTMEFLFIDHRFASASEGDYQQRFETFNAIMQSGEARVLVHPYEGSVNCRAVDFSHDGTGDNQSVITASATFVEEITIAPVFAAGAGAQTRVSVQDAAGAQVSTDQALEELGLTSDVTADALAAVESWQADPTLSARRVQLEMASINNRLNAELDAFDAYDDVTRFPLVKEYTLLQYTMRRAAESFTTTTTRIVKLKVTEPLPLKVIAARFYGAAQAERRFGELRELNPELHDPLLIPRNTELRAYAPSTESRRFRS